MWRILKRIVIWIFILFLVITGSGMILSVIFRDEVNSILIEEINRRIVTEINVREVKFSLIKKFPNASVEFREVLIHPPASFSMHLVPSGKTDTLLYADRLFLEFSMFDFLRKEFRIKSIHADRGMLNIFVNSSGDSNYRFWRKGEDTDTSTFEIKLNDLKFSRLNVHVVNLVSQFDFKGFSEMFGLKGNFSSRNFQLQSVADMFVEKLRLEGIDYISGRQTDIDIEITVNDSQYTIDKGKLLISGLRFGVTGSFSTGSLREIDLIINGRNLDLTSIISVLPGKMHKRLKNFRTMGTLDFEARLSGNYGIKGPPHYEFHFGLEEGTMFPRGSDIRLDHLSLSGIFTNGTLNNNRTALLSIDNYSFSIEGSELSGSAKILNFENPQLELFVTGLLNLAEVQRFFQPDTVEYMRGMVRTNLKLEGPLRDFREIKKSDLEHLNPVGQAVLKNVSFKLKDDPKIFSEVNGTFMFGNHIWIDGATLDVNGNSFYIEGKLGNALPYLFSRSKYLLIEADIHSDEVVFDRFLFDVENVTDKDITTPLIRFPDDVQMNLNLSVANYSYQDFSATNLTGRLSYIPETAVLESANFNSMGGKVSGWGILVQSQDGGYSTRIKSKLEQINITDLFRSFKNFGQEYIRDIHLKGNLTGEVDFTAELDPGMKVIKETVLAESHLIINDGELIDFEPMLGLSKFIEVSELRHITFSTLENEIVIKDEKVTIPQMDIHSSAFNITLSGIHDFDNNISYKTRVLLSDVLFRKARQSKKGNEEFGIVEDDGLGRTSLYFTITGTPGDIKVMYDRREMKQAITESLQKEKQELRKILNEEFGWFNRDTVKTGGTDDIPDRRFLIEWDDRDTTGKDSLIKEQVSSKYRIEWKDEEDVTDTTKIIKHP